MLARISPALFRGAFVLAVIVVFILTMIPLPNINVVSNQDKIEHATAFFGLMLLGWAGWPPRAARLAGGLVAYGLLIEVCQATFTTTRSGELLDWVADSIGIAIGWLLTRYLARCGLLGPRAE